MEEQIRKLTEECSNEISLANSENELYSVKVKYLGKSGQISEIMKGMRNLTPEQRPIMGKVVNEARAMLEELFTSKGKELHDKELLEKLASEKIDITLDSNAPTGKLHP
ncbi:MAG: phenylalanine--tRNA ligase subunit alpha, partial [Clostridia bacterium]|nr:phenylalanine--tRNA ligase subunit alpha [Clostridia bacterium]